MLRHLPPSRKQNIICCDHRLSHRGARIRVSLAMARDIAADIYVGQRIISDLQGRFCLDMALWCDSMLRDVGNDARVWLLAHAIDLAMAS